MLDLEKTPHHLFLSFLDRSFRPSRKPLYFKPYRHNLLKDYIYLIINNLQYTQTEMVFT